MSDDPAGGGEHPSPARGTKQTMDVVFAAVLLVVAVAAIVVSGGWELRSRLFVQVVSIPMAVLLVFQVVLGTRRRKGEEGTRMDSTIGGDLGLAVVLRRGLGFVVWLAAFLAATWLFGLMWGGVPVLALYMYFGMREKLLPTALMAAGVVLTLFALRELVSVSLPTGVVFRWLG